MAFLSDDNKVYRIVINKDPNSVDESRLRGVWNALDAIQMAETDALKMYGKRSAAKGMLTRIKKHWPVDGWVEEADLNWTKSEG